MEDIFTQLFKQYGLFTVFSVLAICFGVVLTAIAFIGHVPIGRNGLLVQNPKGAAILGIFSAIAGLVLFSYLFLSSLTTSTQSITIYPQPSGDGLFSKSDLDELVNNDEVYCVTTGNIRVLGDDNKEKIHLTGGTSGSAVCWYGKQRAVARELQGSAYYARFTNIATDKLALSRLAEFWGQFWGNQMIRNADGCGSSPCQTATIVYVSPDGNVQQVTVSS